MNAVKDEPFPMGTCHLTVPQVAKFLNLSRSTIYSMMDNGTLPYVRIGRTRRIEPEVLQALVAKSRVQSQSY